MSKADFRDYTLSIYSIKNSGTAFSYIKGIEIIDNIFLQKDVFNLQGKSLCDIEDIGLATRIVEFIRQEEAKMRKGEDSIFIYGNPNQTSYPLKRFCSAAVAHLLRYVQYKITEQAASEIVNSSNSGSVVGKQLIELLEINNKGTDIEVLTKARVGQHCFRKILLDIYNQKCCLTGLEVPEILRASHIVGWAEDKKNRMNPQNGLCLSATYDAAFDKHLISFDEDYRLILSPSLRDYYTSKAFQDQFEKMEGKQISLPQRFLPDQRLLSKHRNIMIGI